MQSSITVLGLTEKVHDIGSSSVLGTTRDMPILKPTWTGPLILPGDIHSVSAAVRHILLSPKGCLDYKVASNYTNHAVAKRRQLRASVLHIGNTKKVLSKNYAFYIAYLFTFFSFVCFLHVENSIYVLKEACNVLIMFFYKTSRFL